MSSPDTPSPNRARLADSARRVAPFQWKLLTFFLVLGVVSAGVYAAAWFNRPTPASAHVSGSGPSNTVAAPAGARGFVGGSAGATDEAKADSTGTNSTATAAPAKATDTWTGWTGAKGSALGFGFAGGFVIGFIFRAFLKIMTLATLVIVGGLTLLSYYHVLNIDFSAARDVVQSNADWLTEQATRLKDVVMAHLPSSSAGTAGAFFGLRRK